MNGRRSLWIGVGLVIIGLLGLVVVLPPLLGNGTQYGGSSFGLGRRTFSYGPDGRGRTVGAMTTFARALRDGVDPEGTRLDPPMAW